LECITSIDANGKAKTILLNTSMGKYEVRTELPLEGKQDLANSLFEMVRSIISIKMSNDLSNSSTTADEGMWTCTCGKISKGKFCSKCGQPRNK